MNLQDKLKEWSEMTKNNLHTEVRRAIANEMWIECIMADNGQSLVFRKYSRLFLAIKYLQDKEQNLHPYLAELRSKYTDEMLAAIAVVFGKEVCKQVEGVL